MTIKNIITHAMLAVTALAITACQNVDENERTIYVPPVTAKRAVLIEDFTGQSCINCPKANDMIHELQHGYEQYVVAVAIHSGRFSKNPPRYQKPFPLWTAMGDEYYNHWGISTQPNGIINRNGGEQDIDSWHSKVQNALKTPAQLTINAKATYNSSNNDLDVETIINAMPQTSINGNLQLWVVQDNIVGVQYQPDGSINDSYVHNHVLRFAVNGTWGETISVAAGSANTITHSCNLTTEFAQLQQTNADAPAFVPANMWVVAFVYNDSGVLNVVQVPLQITN